ncbi:Tethering factor for nuclear proteasome sts1 [Clydaea vesicula]|uniref:Tethering factor for nuclear proteasome STS1 n=1 Tax=Clydaea vesicula TaxID=447962 RepID=A0AAD5TZ73_9FUNG|nr:Tethering factor for nuclear proteasome sts1 [Clydaea vesicula]
MNKRRLEEENDEDNTYQQRSNKVAAKRYRRDGHNASQEHSQQQSDSGHSISLSMFHLEKILPTLEKDQLLSIVKTLIQNFPQLNTQLQTLIPKPSLSNVTSLLQNLEKKLQNSFPYSKNGTDRSDYSFNRTRPILTEITETIVNYLPFFTVSSSYSPEKDHEFPNNSVEYLHLATNAIHRLPVWSNEKNNVEIKHVMYMMLAKSWRQVISEIGRRVVEEGKVFPSRGVNEWARYIHFHNNEVNGHFGFNAVLSEFNQKLGWILGSSSFHQQSAPWQMQAGGITTGLQASQTPSRLTAPFTFNS